MERKLSSFNLLKPRRVDSKTKKQAGFRISSFILTKAWRKRCNLAKDLDGAIEDLAKDHKRSLRNFEEQKSFFYQKQQENEKLTCHLRMTQMEIEKLQSSIEELEPLVEELEDKKYALMSEFSDKSEQLIETNMRISDFQSQINQITERNAEIELQIKAEQEKSDQLNEKENHILNEISEIKTQTCLREEDLLKQIEDVDKAIQRTKDDKKRLKDQLTELKKFTENIESLATNNPNGCMELEKVLLRKQALVLEEALNQTFENRLYRRSKAILTFLGKTLEKILTAFPTKFLREPSTINAEIRDAIAIEAPVGSNC